MKVTTVSVVNSAATMLRSGVSIREAVRKLSLGRSTIGRIKMEHCPGVESSKSGRPRALSEADKRYCVCKVAKERFSNAVKITKLLEKAFLIKVHTETVRGGLRTAGLGVIEKPEKKFCLDWTVDDWKRVIWTDQTKINRFNLYGRQWAWIRSGAQLQNQHVVKLTL
ncbi:conserved hypothetical protein [Mucor ambiguus]|uniref:Transposase Tc1-like domain-containing protein n=1 Tax=Mucor ambiguus TaxID=91626 RepID=A0A0C9MJI1_9FUNG|nr:conserved hypothetical protein [Mucor ambiguus]